MGFLLIHKFLQILFEIFDQFFISYLIVPLSLKEGEGDSLIKVGMNVWTRALGILGVNFWSNYRIPRILEQPLLKVWIHLDCSRDPTSGALVSGYKSLVDTGQFVDPTVISTTRIWIQVICGYRSVC